MENLPILENEWYVLNEMLGDLKSKGIRVPVRVNEGLRFTRFIITHYKDTNKESHAHRDYFMELEATLNSVKTTLFALAQEVGVDYVAQWEKKIEEAHLKPPPRPRKTFVKGVPRDRGLDLVRIRFDRNIPESELAQIAHRHEVDISSGEEGIVVLSGAKEKVKSVIREIREKYF